MPTNAVESINELFPWKVCINLDRRADRWRRMQARFQRHEIRGVRRFSALDGAKLRPPPQWRFSAGAYGCLLSHVQVVREARARGMSRVFVFEDDVIFPEDFQARFNLCITQLPADWDMVFFGVLHLEDPIGVADNVVRIRKAYSTYAYALNHTVYDDFLALNNSAENPLDKNHFGLQARFNCYCFAPHLAWVEADYSDAQQRLENHWYLRYSLVLFGDSINRLLAATTVVIAYCNDSGDDSSEQNLLYLLQYYYEFFAGYLAVIVVEQGDKSSLDPRALPANCRYLRAAHKGPFDPQRCFRQAVAERDGQMQYFIFSDSDIYLEPMDIRANLRMCEHYDAATGFRRLFALSVEDTLWLHKNKTTRGLNLGGYCAADNNRHCCCIVGNRALEALASNTSLLPLEKNSAQLSVFESPNHALRLHSGGR